METNNKNLYHVLGVDESASDAELKDAYREKIKEHHPDKNGDKDKATEVINAYTVLKNPERRKKYDETGSTDNNTFDQRFFAFVGGNLLKIIEANSDVESVDIVSQFKELVAVIIHEAEEKKKTHRQATFKSRKGTRKNHFYRVGKQIGRYSLGTYFRNKETTNNDGWGSTIHKRLC